MRERALAANQQPRYDGRCRERAIPANSAAPFCIRLRVPSDAHSRWNDLLAGPSGQDLSLLDDFVIERSDGTPIYHLAVVVDDHDMGVTHVIRGREHLSSTPRQLLLYQAFGWPEPSFAHVPLLTDPSGKKLSKRLESASVQTYRDRGFTPEAVLNFLCRLGWGSGDLEVFSSEEFVRLFTLEGVGVSPSQVNEDKLLWLNQHYIKTLPIERLIAHVATVEGSKAKISVVKDNVMINGANVVAADIDANNGVIHVIDSVILPPAREDGKKASH